MPEVTTCPDCDKKLKVPDTLLGKKVRCPGCGEMFVAKVAGDEEEPVEQEEAPIKKTRSDNVSNRKSSPRVRDEEEDDPRRKPPRRDEEEEEEERPRARSRRDEDEEERPRKKSRRDDEDDRDRNRGVRRSEDFDRPRHRRDEYDDEPDRSSWRDEDDYPRRRRLHPEDEARGWRGTAVGVYLAALGMWMWMAALGLVFIYVGIGALGGGAMLAVAIDMRGADAQNLQGAALGFQYLMICLNAISWLLFLASSLLVTVGQGLCMQVPCRRSSGMRVLAIIAFSCSAAWWVIAVTAFFIGLFLLSWVCHALALTSFICWICFLRGAAIEVGDHDLGWKFVLYMIITFTFNTVVALGLIIVICGVAGFAFSRARQSNPNDMVASMGVGMMLVAFFAAVIGLVAAWITGWYSLLLLRLRVTIAQYVTRL